MDSAKGDRRQSGAPFRARAPCGFLFAGLLPLLLYLRTMPRSLSGLDSAELAAGAWTLGIVHAPGCPAYLLFAQPFLLLPVGDVAYRMGLFSAFSAALAIAFLWATLRRLGVGAGRAFAAAWVLAVAPVWWANALVAELYSPGSLLLAVSLWGVVRWKESGRIPFLLGATASMSLALGVHLALASMLPGFVFALCTGRQSLLRSPGLFAVTTLVGLCGPATYLYIPIRASMGVAMDYARQNGVDASTVEGFWWMLSAKMFEPLFFALPLRALPGELLDVAAMVWRNMFGFGAVLVAIAAFTRTMRPELRWALRIMAGGFLCLMVPYGSVDKLSMYSPFLWICALWLGVASQRAADWIEKSRVGALRLEPGLLVGVLAASSLAMNFRSMDCSKDQSARERGAAILATLPTGSLFIGSWLDIPILEYMQHVDERRLDVRLLNSVFVHGQSLDEKIAGQLASGRPVFVGEGRGLQAFSREGLSVEKQPTAGVWRVCRMPGCSGSTESET